MQRDKRGRFIKKANGGTDLNKLYDYDGKIVIIDGKKYKIKSGTSALWA
jgi:hypothetical protein